jgi:hypothetical protein
MWYQIVGAAKAMVEEWVYEVWKAALENDASDFTALQGSLRSHHANPVALFEVVLIQATAQ